MSGIALAAKAHWRYPAAWLDQWREQLTLTSGYIVRNPTFAAERIGCVIGFHAVVPNDDIAVLDHLWVRPDHIGTGVGRMLFAHAENVARGLGARRLTFVGDPHAEGFYRHLGARKTGLEPAPIGGVDRYLPRFEKNL